MFDGKVRGSRMVSSAGKKRESDKSAFMENTRKQREDRAVERKKLNAIVKLQAFIRRLNIQAKTLLNLTLELDKKVSNVISIKSAFLARGTQFNVPLDVLLPIFRIFIFIFGKDKDYRNTCYSTSSDTDRLRRISFVLQLFQDALNIRVPSSFNPFLKAAMEISSKSKSSCDLHRPWEYQVLQLSHISICLIQSIYPITGVLSNIPSVADENLFLKHVELSIQVLYTLIYWQEEASTSIPILQNDDKDCIVRDPSGIVPMEEGGSSEQSSGGQIGGPFELFICSIARFIADSCNKVLRKSLFFNRDSKNDLKDNRFFKFVMPLMTRTSKVILEIIGLSLSPMVIPTTRFEMIRDQNVRYYDCCIM